MENFTNTYKRILPLEALANISLVHHLCFNCLKNGAEWDILHDKEKPHIYLRNMNNNNFDIFINASIEKSIHSRLLTSIKRLPIPMMMKNKLKIYIKLVLDEIWDWIDYHLYLNDIFHQREEGFIINFITDIVWKSDGLINYPKTALNMLSNWRINDAEKFIIISLYCMEEQLRTISAPIINGNDWLIEKIKDSDLLQSWYIFVQNNKDTSRVPTWESRTIYVDPRNIYATWYYLRNEPLSNRDLETVDSCLKHNSVNHQMAFMSLMNKSQRYTILHSFGYKIIIDCAKQPFFLGRAQSIWMEIKNTITEKDYCYIISMLLCYQPYIQDFLMTIWKTTPDHLRHTCLDIENGNLLKYLTSTFHASTSDIVNRVFFLLQIISNMTATEKLMVHDKFINGRKASREFSKILKLTHERHSVLKTYNPWLTHKFYNECLLHVREPVQLRELFPKTDIVKDDCFKLLIEGKYKDLEAYLQCYFVEMELADLKIQLLSQANDRYQPILQNMILLKKYDCLINAIDYVFPNTIVAPDIRRKLYFFDSCFDTWLMAGRFDHIQECLNQLFQPEDDGIIKKRLVQYYAEDRRFSKLFFSLIKSHQHIDKFLSWCFDEDLDQVLEYRRSLNVKGISNAIESEHVHKEDKNHKMSKINDFLLWYFGSQEKVDEFKINEPDESDLFSYNFEIQCSSDDNYRYISYRIEQLKFFIDVVNVYLFFYCLFIIF